MSAEVSTGPGSTIARAPGYDRARSANGMGGMFVAVVRAACTRPFNWAPECVEQLSIIIRRCLNPALLSIGAYALGLGGIFVGSIVKTLGTLDRSGGGLYLGFTREASVWVTTMILAGVAGSAMTADLGARKVREEIDAFEVLGVNPLRSLILPRVVAMTLAGPILGVLVLVGALAMCFLSLMVTQGDVLSPAAYFETTRAFVLPAEHINHAIKLILAGALVGTVSCYKGMNASGGAEGVGRAVNEAVLISFVGVWTISVSVNTIYASLFPSVSILRG